MSVIDVSPVWPTGNWRRADVEAMVTYLRVNYPEWVAAFAEADPVLQAHASSNVGRLTLIVFDLERCANNACAGAVWNEILAWADSVGVTIVTG